MLIRTLTPMDSQIEPPPEKVAAGAPA